MNSALCNSLYPIDVYRTDEYRLKVPLDAAQIWSYLIGT
jgi:hypothetical protein